MLTFLLGGVTAHGFQKLNTEDPYMVYPADQLIEKSADVQENPFGFLKLGFNHILDGEDHLLFVLGITLVPGYLVKIRENWWPLAKMVTAFTAGHATTIILNYYGYAQIPSLLVEGAIALSIALIGFENLAIMKQKLTVSNSRRYLVLGIIGLIHGMGFAGALDSLTISASHEAFLLAAFNLGIELGQIAFMLVAGTLAYISMKYTSEEFVVEKTSLFLFLAGGIWTVTRVVPEVLGIV
ncbi:MAG: HupE/UreJ family protein [Candidatus Nanohaloarchaea archaeon]|nr:HupE/UreJ family protein [Candidatus Nanohaloarchaea archaeon]